MKALEQALESIKLGLREAGEASPVQKLVAQVLISKAATLARAGRYGDALQALSELSPEERTSAVALDLQARILAQQGRLSEAEALWKQTLRVDSMNAGYEASLRRIAVLQRQRVTGSRFFIWGGVLIEVLLLFWIALAQSGNRQTLASKDISQFIEEQQAVKAEIARLRETITGLVNANEGIAASAEVPNLNVQLPGVRSVVESNAVVLSFDEGLFHWGSVLKPEAEALLTTLGHKLEPYSGQIVVHVVGHTDDIPMSNNRHYSDNIALGLDRARIVANRLRMTTEISADALTISSLGSYQPPFPQHTLEDRERNRTVTLRLALNEKDRF